jgi:thiamine kinase-like enzyme
MEEKVKAQLFKPDHTNKFYKKASGISNKSMHNSNYTFKESNESKRSAQRYLSGNNLTKELNNLQNIVSEIKEFQTGKNSLKFVEKDIREMKEMLGSLKEIVNENKNFVEKFDDEFEQILKKEYLTRSNRKRLSVPKRKMDLKKNQSENTVNIV